jgi:hypothetical protein
MHQTEIHQAAIRQTDISIGSARGTTVYPRMHAATSPEKPALIMAASGEPVTYRELDEAAPTGKLYKRLLRDPYWEGREVRI